MLVVMVLFIFLELLDSTKLLGKYDFNYSETWTPTGENIDVLMRK